MAGVGRNGGGKVMYCFWENILSRRVTEKESKPLRFTLFFFTAYAGKAVCSYAWGHCLTRYLLNIRVFIIIEN